MGRRITILVTGVGGRSVGHQILQALFSVDNPDYKIIVCDADSFSFGLYQVEDRRLVPKASLEQEYLARILELISQDKIDIILPGTEVELFTLARHKSLIEQTGCRLLASDYETIDLCLNKSKLYNWLIQNNIGLPQTGNFENWQRLVKNVGFPIVAKPSDFSGGSRNVEILSDESDVRDYISRFPRDKEHIIFQEYVGDDNSEYTVGVLADNQGYVCDSIVLKRTLVGLSLGTEKIIQGNRYALSTGYSQGLIIKDEKIQSFCENLIQRINIRGPANIQLRIHFDGTIKVFEIHPRFSGTTSIRAQAGFNEVDLAIRNFLLNEPITRQTYQTNVAAIRAFQNKLVPLDIINKLEMENS